MKISPRIGIIIVSLGVLLSLTSLMIAKPLVHAQEVDSVAQDGGVGALVGVGTVVAPGGIPVQDRQQTIFQKITAIFQRNFKIIGQSLFQTSLQTYLNNLAYNTATFIAQGAPGGKPLVRTKSFGRVLNDSRDAAYGDFIGNLSEDFFKGSGLNLCAPSLNVQANITLGVITDVGGQALQPPKCELNQIKANWAQFGRSLDSGQWLAQAMVNLSVDQRTNLIGALVDPNQNDLGIFLQVESQAFDKAQRAEEVAKITETTCMGYLDKGANISDDVKVHCAKVMGVDQNSYRDALLEASLIKTEDVFLNAAKLFAKSLTAKLLNKYISGSWSLANLYGDSSSNLRDSLINRLRNKVDLRRLGSATDFLADLKTVNVEQIDDFDYLQNLTACPPDRKLAQPDNCTIDNTFLAAINNKETVGEAMAQGHLRADWPLISYLNASQNGDKNCFQNGYCYGNIARLRSYRLVPVGWEIAAALSPVARPVTLGEAVECFDNGSKCILPPEANIFYHLIDPNWVLTAPTTQCKALVYGPTLEDVTSNQRQQICVDRPSCLSQDSKGNCIGGYGYCTQERNIWRFSGEQCQEQYSSCQVLVRRDNGAKYSYLQNTLEPCEAGQAGCSWYSLSQENVGTAANPNYQWNPNDRIYFNNKVVSCPQQDAGCQEFIDPQTAGANLLPNGTFDTYTLNIATDQTNADYFNDALPDSFSGWLANGANFNVYTAGNDNAYLGTTAIKAVGDGQLSNTARVGSILGSSLTLSWYGKADSACTANAALGSQTTSAVSADVDYTTSWQRFQLTHTFGLDNLDQQVTVFLGSLSSCGALYIDGVKVERGTTPSSYTNYGSSGKLYLNGTRVSCSAEEVGCNLYAPVAGGSAVPGVVSNADRCPAECVGYQTYLQLPTPFDLIEQPTATASNVNFIAKTAKQCNATDIGCSAFTNLDEVAAGGEGLHYYSYLRQCVAANLGVTYYTLEGSDTSGFQVRTWQVLKSNIDGGPCTNVTPGATTCSDTAATQATCQASDVTTDPNCREFFDTDGVSTYRLQDRVIFADSDCHPLRRSSGIVYSGLDSASRTCPAAVVGCTEYRGNQGNNLRQISSDTFESGSYQPWGVGTVTPSYSTESTNSGGHSMSFASGVVSRSEGQNIVAGREYYLTLWLKAESAGTEFKAFLGKYDGSETKCNNTICEFTAANISPIQPTTSWQPYQLGPLYLDQVLTTNDIALQLEATPKVFVDNIELKESISNLSVVANSWSTPGSCDQPFVGANLGCQAYKGPNGSTVTLRSFSQICREEAIGCQAVVNTQNSNSPYQQTFNAGDRSEITVPDDALEYVVVDQKKSCSASFQGCSLMGKPTFNRDLPEVDPDYIQSYAPVFQINDPDTYDQQLCQNSGLFCQEYADSSGQSVYYRDPYNRTCTYKEGVSILGVSFTGWFQTDSLQAGKTPVGCYSQGIPPLTQDQFEIHPFVDPLYAGWVGTCPASQNQCSEFVDTQATSGDNLFANATFANGTTGWASWRAYGNTLTGSSLFSTDAGTATIKTNPTGTGLFFQRLFTLDPDTNLHLKNTQTYNLSADVNIKSFFNDDHAGGVVQVVMRCVWDSPYDQDYCGTKDAEYNVTVNYSQPCTSNAQCGGGSFCYKAAQGYCQSSTNKTNRACTTDSQCATLGTGYTCQNNFGYESTDSQGNRRDHLAEYYVGADVKQTNTTQSINVVANIGAQSQGDELVYCEPTFRVASGYYQASNSNCPANGNNENNLSCYNTACTNTGQACNPVSTSCGSGSCGGTSQVEFSSVSLRQVKSYYYLDNDNIDDSSCNGQVSKNTGCILFDDTNDSQKTYNSYLTYLASEKVNGKPVSPVVCDPNSADPNLKACTNDANRIIKVSRDRECSQWLACKSSTQIFDPQTKGYRQICSEVGLCDKYSVSGDLLNCANWLPENQTKLDYSAYTSRDTRYEATDYSGMSLYNRYPVDNLHLLDISINSTKSGPDTLKPDFRLVKFVDCIDTTGACNDADGPTNDLYGDSNYAKCGLGDIGRVFAYNGSTRCVVGIDGSRFDSISPYVVKVSTRAYAEQDGPFPQSIASGSQSGSRKVTFGFQQANICDSTVASCERGYYKMQYGSSSAVRYYSIDGPLGGTEVPTCICDGGALDGGACNRFDANDLQTSQIDQQCPGGSPILLRRSDVYLNWPGYCLEPDTSNHINASATQFACLSWLPVDTAPGGTDYFNQNREAGYSYKAPAYYCLQTDVIEERRDFKLNDCMTTNQTSERFEYADANGNRTGQKWNGKFVHGDYVVGINQSVSCDRGWNVSDQAYWHFYPLAREGSKEYCLNNPEIIGYFDHDTRGRLYYTNYCVARYNGDTMRLVNTHDGDSGQFIDTIESAPVAQCSYLAKAVDTQGNNAAVTNVFWSEYKLPNGLEYTINIGSGNGYKLSSSDTPFGSAIPSSGLEPKDFPRLDMKSVGQTPNAGSPYACSNDDAICGLLAQKGSDAYINTWTDPGFVGDENYADGMTRLRSIYKRIFGIYHYISGSVCNFNVCDGGLRGGQNCQGVGGSSCVLSDQNHCTAFSNCVNSPWGQNRPCSIQCAPGFSPNSAGNCEQNFNSQIACATACTTYITNINSTNDVDKAVVGTGDCSQTSAPYKCAYTPSSDTASGKALCQATGSSVTCEANGFRSFCRVNGAFTKIECASALQCQALLQAANEATFCAPPGAHYCSGPDFDDDISKNWLKETVDCTSDFTNGLGQTIFGYNNDTGQNKGDGICQATGAQCKLASKIMVDKGNGPVPYCDEKADSYQPLCNPDTDANCPYGSANAVRNEALPLDGTMPKSQAQVKPGNDLANRPDSYYADNTFGPIIAEALCTDSSGQCSLGKIGNFTVNGQTNGPIREAKKQNLLVNISFYAMAYKQHMPIRSIKIDWGDGSVQGNVGYYKNNWPQCDASLALNTSAEPLTNFRAGVFNYTWGAGSTLDFGGTSQACEEGIRNYFHVYSYSSDPKYTTGCEAGYACYKPTITIQDNWGWCTGNTWGAVGTNCPATPAAPRSAAVEYGGGDSEDVIKIKAPTN